MAYPIKQRKTTLTVDFFHIQRQIGAYLGEGYAQSEWDPELHQTITDLINDGLYQYYFPPVLEPPYAIGANQVHEWSFMRPVWNFSTAANQRRYNLPEDFEHPIGKITFPDTDRFLPIIFTHSERLRSLEFQQDYTSYPVLAALELLETQGESPQEQIMILHPTPDSAYALTLQYQSGGRAIDKDHPFPLGGQLHGAGILDSCLALAELRKEGARGPRWQRFMSTLTSNIVRDHKRSASSLGYMGNGRGNIPGRGDLRDMEYLYYDLVTIGGEQHTGL